MHAPERETHDLDSQQVEILGRTALTAALVADGLEVATPERDAGIDLLAFSVEPWAVVPIQMKAASKAAFSIHRKYETVPGLVMVYAWNVRTAAEVEFYAMDWIEALAVAGELGWTETASWIDGGRYDNNQPGARVRGLIEPHRMGPGRWRDLVGLG